MVAHITDVHPADDTRIYHKECRSLAQAGYRVTLIAPRLEKELADVVFLPISKPAGRLGRMILGPLRVLARARQANADIYHIHDPELIPVGLILKLFRKRVIYDAHEDLPSQVAHKTYLNPFQKWALQRFARGLNWVVSTRFDAIIAATPCIAASFPGPKTWVVRNYPKVEELNPGVGALRLSERECCAVYVGGINESRGIIEMLDAAAWLGPRLGFRLLLAGRFESEHVEALAKSHPGWLHTEFLGWLDRQSIASTLSRARCGLVPLHPTPAYVESLPVKMFEYMAAGLPVIASRFELWVKMFEDRILWVDPRDGIALSKTIEGLFGDIDAMAAMAIRASRAIHTTFQWSYEERALFACYENVSPEYA